MPQEHKKDFRLKHPPNTTVAKEIMDAVAASIVDGKISCRAAFKIVEKHTVPASQVGVAIDMQQARITACQLGLFGYGKGKKKGENASQFDESVTSAINNALENGRLSCHDAWQVADKTKTSRIDLGKTCNSLAVRICQCQLGAF